MVQRKYGLAVAVLILLILGSYSLWWVHLKTLSSEGPSTTSEGREWLISVNASNLSCILGREEPLGSYTFSRRGDVYVEFSYRPIGFRNVWCDQLSVSGNSTLYLRPENSSVAIIRVLFVVENVSNVSVGPVFPKRTDVMYLRINGGKFEVTEVYVPGVDYHQAFQVRALKPAWGESISLRPFIPLDFDIRSRIGEKPDVLTARVLVVIRVEYLVRTGFLTSEKREMVVRIPIVVRFDDLKDCTYGCEP